jgi:glutamyl-tRNA reductase
MHWLDQRGSVPLIQQPTRRPMWRSAEPRAKKLLARGESIEEVLEAMSRGLTQKNVARRHG